MLVEVFLANVPVIVELPEDDAYTVSTASMVIPDARGALEIDEGTVKVAYLKRYCQAAVCTKGYALGRKLLIAGGRCEIIASALCAMAELTCSC